MAGRFPPRIFRRVPFEAEIRVRFEDGGEEAVTRTANISLGGMFVLLPQPRPVGTAFELEFKLPEQPAPVRGRGRVVWIREEAAEGLPTGMGVRFLELTPGSRELIFQVVERRVRDGGSPYDEGSADGGSIDDRYGMSAAADDAPGTAPGTAPETTPETAPGQPPAAAPAAAPTATSEPLPAVPPGPGPPDGEGTAPLATPVAPPTAPPGGESSSDPEEPGDRAAGSAGSLPPPPESITFESASVESTAGDGASTDTAVTLEPAADEPASPVRLVEMPHPEPSFPYGNASSGFGAAGYAGSASAAGAGYTRSGRGRSALWIALAAVLLAAAGGWYWLSRQDGAAAEPATTPVSIADSGAVGEASGEGSGEEVEDASGDDGVGDSVGDGGQAAEDLSVTEPAADVALGADVEPGADAGGEPDAVAAAPSPAPSPPPSDRPAATAAAPEPAAPGPSAAARGEPASRISHITWKERNGGTDLTIWGDGTFGDGSYRSYRLEGSSPREVVRLLGIGEPLEPGTLEVGTAEVRRVRTGLHLETEPDELHVVIDLTGPQVGAARIRPQGSRLLLRLEGR